MHRSRSLGQSLVISSVFQWQRLSTDPLLQAVGDGRVYVMLGGGPSLNEWRHLVEKQVFHSPFAMLSVGEGVRLGPEAEVMQSGGFFSFYLLLKSLVCYAQFRSVVVSLQSPFQHTTDPEMTARRISQ